MASPKLKPGQKLINIVVPSELHRKLKVLGAELGRTQPSLVTEALEHWFECGQVPKEPKESRTAPQLARAVPKESEEGEPVPQPGGKLPHVPIEAEAEPMHMGQTAKEAEQEKRNSRPIRTALPKPPDPKSLLRIDMLKSLNENPWTSSELTARVGPGGKNFD